MLGRVARLLALFLALGGACGASCAQVAGIAGHSGGGTRQSLYTAASDRLVHLKPAPLTLGVAGFTFNDPTFGTPMLRVTDANTDGGLPIRVPSDAHLSAWNSTSTKFLLVNSGGGTEVFSWDGMTAAKLNLTVGSQTEPSFSFVDPDLIYGALIGTTLHQIKTWKNNVATLVLDLDVQYPGFNLANTYVGGLQVVDNDVWVTFFGGTGQDQHVYVHHSTAGLLDISAEGWKLHAIALERSGRYVFLFPRGSDIAVWGQVRVWDTQAQTVTKMAILPGGHGSLGYGIYINQDCCTTSTYDAAQWQIRNIATATVTTDLINPILTPGETYLSDHENWRHAAATGPSKPIISSTYRYGDGVPPSVTYPWRAWDDEIIGISTDGSGVVYRFCHTQSIYDGSEFWDQPIVNVDATGRYALFTSNWGRTVGTARQDVFVCHLN